MSTERASVYWAARSTLVHKPEDLALFDRAFAVFWDHASVERRRRRARGHDDHAGDRRRRARPTTTTTSRRARTTTRRLTLRFSAVEVLRHKDFGAYDDDELEHGPAVDEQPAVRRPAATVVQATILVARLVDPICARRCAARSVPAASRSAGTGRSPASGCAGWCCCSTSAARWSRTPGRCCASCTPRSPAANGSRRSPSAPA